MKLFQIPTSDYTVFSGDNVPLLSEKVNIIRTIIEVELEFFKNYKNLEFIGDPRSISLLEISPTFKPNLNLPLSEYVLDLVIYEIGHMWSDNLRKFIPVKRSLSQEERYIICNGSID